MSRIRNVLKDILSFISNRIFIIFVVFLCFTSLLLSRLFELQIIYAEDYQGDLRKTDTATLPVMASRGEIYDKMGRPLAVNVTTYTVKLNPGAEFNKETLNDDINDLLKLFEENGEKYIDELPISADEPYTLMFAGSKAREKRWREDMNVSPGLGTGTAVFEALRKMFDIDPDMPNAEARKIVSVRSAIYMKRFKKYASITLAVNASDKTMAVIEEEQEKYTGVYIEPDYLRQYPGGIAFSHIIGYIGKLTADDYENYERYGYEDGDMVGKTGLEQAFELQLRGKNGTKTAQIDAGTGRVLSTPIIETQPVPGARYFLTVDSRLQEKAYEILENKLKEILLSRLRGKSEKDLPLTAKDIIISMSRSGSISIKKVWQASPLTYSNGIKEYVLKVNPEIDPYDGGILEIKDIIAEGIFNNDISMAYIIMVMIEQGVITADETLIGGILNGSVTPHALILQKLEQGEITPQMANVDPASASVVVLDVNTGGVLAAASYPTYDNYQMTHNLNEYFPIINEDATSPTYYRAFRERRAPGSTFKMITAVTGLEEGSISLYDTIYDELVFTKAGEPYVKCWSGVSHGSIGIIDALAVSCNYFFCETAYLLGNAKAGNPNDSINALNKYMTQFGLNDRAGVEIGEAYDTRAADAATQMQISSPAYKAYLDSLYDKTIISRWFDGDTVATAIGQSKNNYTAANMAKYVATLANGGTRYQVHFTDKKEDYKGDTSVIFTPVVQGAADISPSTLNAVFEGMKKAVGSSYGTGSNIFAGFPYEIGGKTGTAQENPERNDHTSFAGFAPFNDPQIAIYVVIPFGNTSAVPYASADVAKDIIAVYMGEGSAEDTHIKEYELTM